MTRVSNAYLRTAVLFALAAMGLGVAMGVMHDFALKSVHAHLNLLGWVSLFLYGLFYRLVPQGSVPVAWVQFVLGVVGLLIMMVGVGGIATGRMSFEPLAKIGSIGVVASMILFAVNVVLATRAPSTAAARPQPQPRPRAATA